MKQKRRGFSYPIRALICLLILEIGLGVRAQSPNRVGLVVQFGNGATLTRCIEFTEDEISGYDVLMRSGLRIIASTSSGIGTAICKIEDDGCPAENCFCKCRGAACTYWSYWHLNGDIWEYSRLGAGSYKVRHGQVEGWRWGTEASPPVISFDQICAPAAAPTPLPPTATPTLPPPRVSFNVVPESIVAGECVQLVWTVKNAQAVYLDGVQVGGEESKQICPLQTQTCELRVVSAHGESRHMITINVIQPAATSMSGPPEPAPTTASTATSPRAQSAEVVLPTATPSFTPPASRTPAVLPVATLTPASVSLVAITPTPTCTVTPTQASLLAYIPTHSSSRPALVATTEPLQRTVVRFEYAFFVACLLFLLVLLMVTIRKK